METLLEIGVKSILTFLVIVFAAAIICGVIAGVDYVFCLKIEKEIVGIGGCDRYDCGVIYSDGTFDAVRNPVVGQKRTVCQ